MESTLNKNKWKILVEALDSVPLDQIVTKILVEEINYLAGYIA